MTKTPDGDSHRDEVRKIAAVARAFNDACGQYFRNNPDVPERLKARIGEEEARELEYHARELAQWASVPGWTTHYEMGMARASLAFCDLFAGVVYNNDMAEPFAALIPAEMRTQENVKLCRKLGLDHFARLCRPG